MADGSFAGDAIDATMRSGATYFKFLSANDTGATGAHQSGFLLGTRAYDMAFGSMPKEHVMKRTGLRITWQDGLVTGGTFTRYQSKGGEMRLTGMGRGFPYRDPDLTGALWVLSQVDDGEYESYILNTDDEISEYLAAFSLGPQDANSVISRAHMPTEDAAIRAYVDSLGVSELGGWPTSQDVSHMARVIRRSVSGRPSLPIENPDGQLIEYTRVEYTIFREIESQVYGERVARGFGSVDDFVALANTVLNRRKSRAGRSFEHHLASLFRANDLRFEEQVVTEGNKRPDFVFPSGKAYHDPSFPSDRIIVLGAKTTCKDRWRQVVTEADRVRNRPKYLVTMQQGISPKQLEEMASDNVRLVVPKEYIRCYPGVFQAKIWSLKSFIGFVRELELL